MNRAIVLALLGVLFLSACGTAPQAPADSIATAVAATLTASALSSSTTPAPTVVAQLASDTPGALPEAGASPTPLDTPLPTSPPSTEVPPVTEAPRPSRTPSPQPTPVLLAVVPVDGSDDSNVTLHNNFPVRNGQNIVLPGISPDRVNPDEPFVFEDRVAMRVVVFDAGVGQHDGDGIESVRFTISAEDSGAVVWEKLETSAPYCAFGGDDPNCPAFEFADRDPYWPSRDPVVDGGYNVEIVITPYSGEADTWRWRFLVDLPGTAQPPASQYEPVMAIAEIAPGSTGPVVTTALAFHVTAFDPDAGTEDGAGIRQVELSILDDAGSLVYSKIEVSPGYCAFGGGDPDCSILVFADAGYEWRPGVPINPGTYTLLAVATADDGGTAAVEVKVEFQIQP